MDKQKALKIIKILFIHLLVGTIVGTIVLITHGFCPIKAITGYECPGCGLTRAFIAFFKGDFSAAIDFHPMFWAVPLMAVIVGHISLIKTRFPKTYYALWVLFFALAIAFVGVYIYRMVIKY